MHLVAPWKFGTLPSLTQKKPTVPTTVKIGRFEIITVGIDKVSDLLIKLVFSSHLDVLFNHIM